MPMHISILCESCKPLKKVALVRKEYNIISRRSSARQAGIIKRILWKFLFDTLRAESYLEDSFTSTCWLRYVGSHACVCSAVGSENKKPHHIIYKHLSLQWSGYLRLVAIIFALWNAKKEYKRGGVDGIAFCGACKIIGASILRPLGFD